MTEALVDRLKAALADRYVIERELGQGGMATVYLAQDVRHDRQVAVKVLKPELAAVIGAERFLQEIRVTAHLQHPHILPLFDSGEADSFLFYVMPFVEGESLRDRLSRETQLPVEEAIQVTTSVASALDYAHRHKVIHRDIKPENILLHDGQPVVADFGIALAVSAAGGTRLTETGLSLGTPHYMSPEQAMGERALDLRTDVYALGCVLYEMLAGEPPFTGPTAQAILAKVMTDDPRPITQLRRTVPVHIENALLTALEKLPADRFHSTAAFAEALVAADVRPLRVSRVVARGPVAPTRATWTLASVLLAATVAALWGWLRPAPPLARETTRRAVVQLGRITPGASTTASIPTLSADGSLLFYVAREGFQTAIFARPLAALEGVPIPGTEGGEVPFVSPDGGRLGFRRGSQIFVVPTSGGVATRVQGATLPAEEGRATWTPDGRIVYTDHGGGLILVRADGSSPDTLTQPEPEALHLSPIVLPNGENVLYSVVPRGDLNRASIDAVSIASKVTSTLLAGGVMTPQFGDGFLFYVRADRILMAVPFVPGRVALGGQAVAMPDRVRQTRFGVALFAVAPGVLIYQPGTAAAQLIELDKSGRSHDLVPEASSWHHPRYSPDGRLIVLDRIGADGERDIWILDRQSKILSRVTRVGDAHDPVWTPDGRAATFLSFGTEGNPVKTASTDGGGDIRPLPASAVEGASLDIVHPGAWLPDGRGYIAGVRDPDGRSDLWIIPTGEGAPMRLVGSSYDEHSPAVSPGGRWLAYRSDETGRGEIYVRALGGSGRRLQVSIAGGEEPVWDKRREALYYLQRGGGAARLIEAVLQMSPIPTVARRTVLIDDLRIDGAANHANYDVDPTGMRFVAVGPEMERAGFVAVFGWAASLSPTGQRGKEPR